MGYHGVLTNCISEDDLRLLFPCWRGISIFGWLQKVVAKTTLSEEEKERIGRVISDRDKQFRQGNLAEAIFV